MARARKLTPAERWERTAEPDALLDLLTGDGKRVPTAAAFARKMRLLDTEQVWLATREVPLPELDEPLAVAGRAIDGTASGTAVKAARAAVRRVRVAADREFDRLARSMRPGGPTTDRAPLKRAAHVVEAADVLTAALDGTPKFDANYFRRLLIPYTDWQIWEGTPDDVMAAAAARLVRQLRDLFGNPFAPVAFDAKWNTTSVVGLANTIYEDRAFDRLPVLADAIEEAGCADPAILAHCRAAGEHIRGCWVIDGLFGRNWAPRRRS